MQNKTRLDESIKALNEFKQNLFKASENTEDVKNGDCTPEDERQEPDYKLYNSIADTSIEILKGETVANLFNKIADKLGEDLSKELCEVMAICMTHSAYQAVVFYDGLIKNELGKQFDHISDHLNSMAGVLNGHDGALQVFKSKINDLENEKKLSDIENK